MKTMLDIEVVDIRKMTGDGNLKAFADLKFGGNIIVKGFSVLKGRRGLFVSMPMEQGKNERWYEKVRCMNQDIRSLIVQKVLEAYKE